jgi:isopentenyl phosphate kinase
MPDQDDRRRDPRIPAKVAVKLRPAEGTTPYMISGESINVSEHGLYFTVQGQGMQAGTKIELTFTMPADVTGGMAMKIRCMARVVRVESQKNDGKTAVAAHIERFETVVGEDAISSPAAG